MTETAKQRLQIGIFYAWVGLILIGSFIRVPPMKAIDKLHPDIVFHSAMYVVLAILGFSPFGWWSIMPCIVVGAGTEIAQHFMPYRSESLSDFGVDMAGVALGLIISNIIFLFRRSRFRRAESIREFKD